MKHLLIALALLCAGPAAADSLFVRPTTVVLPAGQSAAVLTISNKGDAPAIAQIRVFAWDQEANRDRLDSTTLLVASPPMTTIPPGSSQIVRLVRVSKTPAAREESYRLLVDEIADTAAKEKIGIALQLRYSIPVFVMPDAGAPLQLSLSGRLEGRELLVDAINSGDTHAQLSNVSIECIDGSTHALNPGLIGYVLPAKNRQWRFALPDAAADKAVREAHAIVNGQRVRIALQE